MEDFTLNSIDEAISSVRCYGSTLSQDSNPQLPHNRWCDLLNAVHNN